jgi:hypothetical protein
MTSLLVPLLLLLLTIPLVVAILRANELFVLRADAGRVVVVRGKIPQRLVNELADVLCRAPRPGVVTLRGVSEDGRVRLYPAGELSDAEKQQLRNVIASWPVVRVRNG